MYSILDIADYIISYSNKNNKEITNMRLQKLLYFIQAEFIMTKGDPCFEENMEAGVFGPYNYKVFNIYKNNEARNIPVNQFYPHAHLEDDDRMIINDTIDACEKYTTAELTDITMKQEPWTETYSCGIKKEIPNSLLKKFFCKD